MFDNCPIKLVVLIFCIIYCLLFLLSTHECYLTSQYLVLSDKLHFSLSIWRHIRIKHFNFSSFAFVQVANAIHPTLGCKILPSSPLKINLPSGVDWCDGADCRCAGNAVGKVVAAWFDADRVSGGWNGRVIQRQPETMQETVDVGRGAGACPCSW